VEELHALVVVVWFGMEHIAGKELMVAGVNGTQFLIAMYLVGMGIKK